MNYDELVQFIRGEGCRVYVYKNKESIYGGNRGTFFHNEHGPIISVVTKNVDLPRRVETLLHEFGHFLQWREGFMQYLDGICDSYNLAEQWISKQIELSPMEISVVRNSILAMEYDAERRGYQQGCELEPDGFNGDFYIRGAASYMDSIKWEMLRRKHTTDIPYRSEYKNILLTNDELFAPLNEEKKEKMDEAYVKNNGKFKIDEPESGHSLPG